jgi:hypothetical protein
MLTGCAVSGSVSGSVSSADAANGYSGLWIFDRQAAANKDLFDKAYNGNIDEDIIEHLLSAQYFVDAGKSEISLFFDGRIAHSLDSRAAELRFPYQPVPESGNRLKLTTGAVEAIPGWKLPSFTITGANQMLVEYGGMGAEFIRPLNLMEGKWLFDAASTSRQFISSSDNEAYQAKRRNELEAQFGNLSAEVKIIDGDTITLSLRDRYAAPSDKNTFEMHVTYVLKRDYFIDDNVGVIALRGEQLGIQLKRQQFSLMFNKIK